VVEVDHQERTRKVQGGQIPDPFRPVAHHHPEEGTVPTPLPGFPIKAQAKRFGGLEGTGRGGGIGIT
jgi:hypothetical protein